VPQRHLHQVHPGPGAWCLQQLLRSLCLLLHLPGFSEVDPGCRQLLPGWCQDLDGEDLREGSLAPEVQSAGPAVDKAGEHWAVLGAHLEGLRRPRLAADLGRKFHLGSEVH